VSLLPSALYISTGIPFVPRTSRPYAQSFLRTSRGGKRPRISYWPLISPESRLPHESTSPECGISWILELIFIDYDDLRYFFHVDSKMTTG
jgi:hypothetical protein